MDFGGAPECGFSVFIEAKLLRTVFTGSRLLGAYFTGADVSGADFTDVSFWVETERASIAEQVSMAVSRFGGATWDSATIWPNDRLAEVFGQASDPATEGTFRVRDEPPSDVVRQPPEGASVRRNDGDVFFDFNR